MHVLLTGSGGLVGRAVAAQAAAAGWRVTPLRRGPGPGERPAGGAWWRPDAGEVDLSGAGPIDAVVHLAGETIAQRWTASAKERIRSSRVEGTRLLAGALRRLAVPPRVIVCASATGYYGERGEAWVDEGSGVGAGFLAGVCRDWEAAALELQGPATRVVCLRFGIVLAREGGALARMLPAFRMGLAGRLGDGRQFWSWITLADLVRALERALQDPALSGPVNAVSPEPVTNGEFTRVLGEVLHRPTVLPVPRFVVTGLFGEMGREAMLTSTRARPARLAAAGFTWQQPALAGALRTLLAPAR